MDQQRQENIGVTPHIRILSAAFAVDLVHLLDAPLHANAIVEDRSGLPRFILGYQDIYYNESQYIQRAV